LASQIPDTSARDVAPVHRPVFLDLMRIQLPVGGLTSMPRTGVDRYNIHRRTYGLFPRLTPPPLPHPHDNLSECGIGLLFSAATCGLC